MRTPEAIMEEIESSLGPAPASRAKPETVVLRFRRHGHRLVLPVVVLVAVAGAAGYWVGALPELWMNLAAAGALLTGLLLGLLPVVTWLARRTTVTTHRVILRRGVFVRHRSEVSLGRVREVRSRRSLGQRLYGSGDIELLVGAESTRLEDVPGVLRVADALRELVERNFEHQNRSFQQTQFTQTTRSPAPGQPADPAARVSFF